MFYIAGHSDCGVFGRILGPSRKDGARLEEGPAGGHLEQATGRLTS